MNEKTLILLARAFSWIFPPFCVPTLGVALLFFFTYLHLLPWPYKILVILAVYCFTILMPQFTIFLYRKINGWSLRELGSREKRIVPYMLTITSYIFCLVMLYRFNVPRYMTGIVVASLIALIICAIINIWWKISEHMMSIGGVVGGLVCFGELFAFNPIWWICITLILAGIMGTSRITLRQHNLGQVLAGFVVGFVSAIAGILYDSFILI